MMRVLYISACGFVLCLFATLAFAQPSLDRILSDAMATETGSCTVLHIRFNSAIRYISHFPRDAGEEVRIKIRPLDGGAELFASGQSESLRPPETPRNLIRNIEYENRDAEGPVVTVSLKSRVSYQVALGPDFRSLIVALAGSEADPNCRPVLTEPLGSNGAGKPAKDKALTSKTADDIFVVTLISLQSVPNLPDLPDAELLKDHVLYVAPYVDEKGRTWQRLRLGFFASLSEARKAAERLSAVYPNAWVGRATAEERLNARSQRIVTADADDPTGAITGAAASKPKTNAVPVAEKPAPAKPSAPQLPGNPADGPKLLEEARAAMMEKNYSRAVQLLTKLSQLPDNPATQNGSELLGLARERNGQKAHAKAEYEAYLARYPQGEGADRVRQRLAGLLGGNLAPKQEPLRAADRGPGLRASRGLDWEGNGSVSQFYEFDESHRTTDERIPMAASGAASFLEETTSETETNVNQLLSAVDFFGGVRSAHAQFRARAAGTYTHDFLDGETNESSLSSLYVEGSDAKRRIFGRAGRQTRFSDGILGRFDGALATVQPTDLLRLDIAGGFPVDTPKDVEINSQRYFYAAGLGLGHFKGSWDGDVYYIRQISDGLLDREAVGFEARYLDEKRSVFTSFDYDINYGIVNLALLSGSWTFPDQTSVTLALDYRRSPLLTTENALQGQSATTLSQLRDIYSLEEIHRLALDRSAESRMVTLSVAKPLSPRFEVDFDGTLSNLSATPASGGVDATPSSGNEYYLSTQLVATDLFTNGDISIFGLRYFDTSTSHRYIADFNIRYPFNRSFRVNPRVRLSYRTSKTNDATQVSVRPSLRMNYYLRRSIQFELEAGGEWTNDKQDLFKEETLGYFFNIGYRADF